MTSLSPRHEPRRRPVAWSAGTGPRLRTWTNGADGVPLVISNGLGAPPAAWPRLTDAGLRLLGGVLEPPWPRWLRAPRRPDPHPRRGPRRRPRSDHGRRGLRARGAARVVHRGRRRLRVRPRPPRTGGRHPRGRRAARRVVPGVRPTGSACGPARGARSERRVAAAPDGAARGGAGVPDGEHRAGSRGRPRRPAAGPGRRRRRSLGSSRHTRGPGTPSSSWPPGTIPPSTRASCPSRSPSWAARSTSPSRPPTSAPSPRRSRRPGSCPSSARTSCPSNSLTDSTKSSSHSQNGPGSVAPSHGQRNKLPAVLRVQLRRVKALRVRAVDTAAGQTPLRRRARGTSPFRLS